MAQAEAPPAPRTGPISGYMELHLKRPNDAPAVLDFHRFVLLFNHSFTDRIRFVGELELEHAFVEGLEAAGELELEQAYLDFLISRAVNVRAGMLLMPLDPFWRYLLAHRTAPLTSWSPEASIASRSWSSHAGSSRRWSIRPCARPQRPPTSPWSGVSSPTSGSMS